jgi:hypothetical protein
MKMLSKANTMKTSIIILSILLIAGCAAMNNGLVQRLAITAISQEMGVEFGRNNAKLATAAIAYLDMADELAQTPWGYRDAIEAGINKAFEVMEPDRQARLKPFVDELLSEVSTEPIIPGDYIKLPEGFDNKALRAAVAGFRSGLDIALK